MARSTRKEESVAAAEEMEAADVLPEADHPDFVDGTVDDGLSNEIDTDDADVEANSGSLDFLEDEMAARPSRTRFRPGPIIPRPPIINFCGSVSGLYKYVPQPKLKAQPVSLPKPPLRAVPVRPRFPIVPINFLNIDVRVDVDRFYPQRRISIAWRRIFPNQTAHVIAEVTSDRCTGYNNRTIEATITYRDGDPSAIQGTKIVFRARRTAGNGYQSYSIQLSGGGAPTRNYNLSFQSEKFDPVDFEVDRVSNSGPIYSSYNTGDHPTRPGKLPSETLSLQTVFERAGFDVTMHPTRSVIPTSGAGANGTWSNSEMHNAMQTYWTRFANRPDWAMWVLYAARHDNGRSLGGIMFDSIGPNHRQGTAIFTDSFIQDVPAGDPDPSGWRRRMQFWTAIHEMGHGFNLAHSWQKSLSLSGGRDPWVPLANEPEARSFMNYPFRVSGGESAFFSDFRFRFSDDELIFMRHAPRRFVQMGNSNWFDNHGFEAPDEAMQTGNWALEVRPNRAQNAYRFMEPVTMELKLTNTSSETVMLDPHLPNEGHHVRVFLAREGGETKEWRPMITTCHEHHEERIDPNESMYGAHMISTSGDGWLIDEPGFYKIQAAIDMGDEIVLSNVARIYVAPPTSTDESALAPDYFTEDVGRVIAFNGAPELANAHDVLADVADRCADNPAAIHAKVANAAPQLRDYKRLDAEGGRERMAIKSTVNKVGQSAKVHEAALFEDIDAAADTIGHIPYFAQCRAVAEALEDNGAGQEAVAMMEKTIEAMKKRDILSSVIDNAERRLKRRS